MDNSEKVVPISVRELRAFLSSLPDDMEVYYTASSIKAVSGAEIHNIADCVKYSRFLPVASEAAWDSYKVNKSTAREAVILLG